MERIKDILYDIGDVLFGFVIILVMVSVVTLKLTSAMDINLLDTSLNTALLNNKDDSESVSDTTKNNAIVIDANDKPDNTSTEETTPPTTVEQGSTVENPVDNSPEVIDIVIDVTLEIPKGSTAVSIAKLLEDKNLVESSTVFLDRVKELNMDPKLRYGTFKLKSNYSIDKIISVITGVKIN